MVIPGRVPLAHFELGEAAMLEPAVSGQPYYTLNFTPSGTYAVTNDLSNGFVLNQLNIAGTVTFAGVNSLAFTGNGPLLPQINQNSVSAVTFSVPLSLAATTVVGGTGGGSEKRVQPAPGVAERERLRGGEAGEGDRRGNPERARTRSDGTHPTRRQWRHAVQI